MTPVLKKALCLACALGAAISLAGCGSSSRSTEPTQEQIITLPTAPVQTEAALDPEFQAESLKVVLGAGELYTLDQYPNLKNLDLTGSTCYEAILRYIETHPQVNVTYGVDLGGTWADSKVTALTLESGRYTAAALVENLQYLPSLTTLSFPGVSLSGQELSSIREAYPELVMEYTVELLGSSYPSTIQELDLSGLENADVDRAIPKLPMLTDLKTVRLGSGLSMSSVAKLQDAHPTAQFLYEFTLFGKILSTADETVTFKNAPIGNEGEAQLRQALDILDSCKRFALDGSQMDSEVLAKIREDYQVKTVVAWRIYFGLNNRYSFMTDDETIRAVYNVTDDTVGPLKYCSGAKYIDMGHNDYLTDLSFLGYMPELEALILSGCAAKELPEGIGNCKKLQWLELANCLKLENIDAVAGCESLRFVNLSNTKVTSYQALDTLPLERFKCVRPKASKAEQQAVKDIHPDCMVSYSGNEYGQGWRYDDNGRTYNEYYKTVIREVFNLDYLESLLPKETKKK